MFSQLEKTIRAAGDMILGYTHVQVFQKEGHANFVTQADMQVQAFLLDKLHAALPGALFFAEEKENGELTDAPTFMIDPIDGTTNFMRGRKCSSISIALLEGREPVLAAILNPYTGELFHAEKGKGAFLSGKPMSVSRQPFAQALVGFGTSPYESRLAHKTLQAAEQFLRHAADIRRTGSAAIDLADIASGRSDIFFELVLSPWDFAAGALLVAEGGGRIGCPGKGKLRFHEKSPVLAANPQCYDQAEEMLLAVLES